MCDCVVCLFLQLVHTNTTSQPARACCIYCDVISTQVSTNLDSARACMNVCVCVSGDGDQQTSRHQVSQSATAEKESVRQLLHVVCVCVCVSVGGGPALIAVTSLPTVIICC